MFGEVGEGIHSYRVLDCAIVDIFGLLLIALVYSKYMKVEYFTAFMGFFILGIICHRIFCVETTFDKRIFTYPDEDDIMYYFK